MKRRKISRRRNPMEHHMLLNIQTRYNQLLNIAILHDYFDEQICKDVVLSPTSDTVFRLKQTQLKTAFEGNNLLIGYGETVSGGPALESLEKPLKLSFWIKVEDAFFLNYTGLPYEFGDYIYHFTNRAEDKIEDEVGNLSNDELVSEMDRLPIEGPVFRYEFDEEEEDAEIEVVDELGQSYFFLEQEGENAHVDVVMPDAPAGKYILQLDGLEEYTFYLAPEGTAGIWGVVDVYIDKEDDSPYRFFDGEGKLLPKRDYNIHFPARSLPWHYYIVEMSEDKQHKGHEAYDNGRAGETVDFEEAEEVEMPSGEMAILVKTSEPVPFKEKQLSRFKLRTKRGKNGIEWITDLPNHSAKSILKTDFNVEDAVFSEIIVYL